MEDYISEADCMTDGADYIKQENYFKDTSKPNKRVGGQIVYRCTRCGQYKSKSGFYKDNRVPCGIRSTCKKCYHKKTIKP